MSIAISNEQKPFLHWVGGKRRIVNKLIEHLPSGPYYNYYEPFLGGGLYFFKLGICLNNVFCLILIST
ncbi:D12 class N6 adenine-specific DNA methyltransferase family protein [Orientia tsutsugamushi str. Gilliam]|uniref:D12 class N6 adenine-specific DNA methyltransferase family protein n=1 Tax=Orientia tsutsugamushi str. Gilliam TaxID=1359184 RepID=A0A0F3MDC1_ORITS|nr:D12 class N6 adenine-specific DNA methyltransferase family protein [Orientia tsutsugamushi str. Gilliam]